MTGEEFIRRARALVPAVKAQARQARKMVMAASGGTAIFLDNPLQRAVRDLTAIRVHPAGNLGKASRSYGRLAFVDLGDIVGKFGFGSGAKLLPINRLPVFCRAERALSLSHMLCFSLALDC